MKKFFVSFSIPAAAIQEWVAKVDETTRKKQSDEMMQSWKTWMETHEASILDKGLPIGKTKRVTQGGISEARNELNWYLIMEADSHESAAEMFKDHPYLQIPSSYIDISETAGMGMQN